MAPYRTNRMNLTRKYKRPYKKRKLSRASLSEGGAGGAHIVMRPGIAPPPQEIKYFDSKGDGVVTGANWTIVSAASLYGIILGGGASQRIGKNIRVVGVILRGTVDTIVAGYAAPWTLDLIQDNQCNGALATVDTMYSEFTNGNSLPNPLFDSRFKFLKRTQNMDPQSPLNQFNVQLKLNTVIEYKKTTGVNGDIDDLSSKNFYLTFCSPKDTASTIDYRMRILYVDA